MAFEYRVSQKVMRHLKQPEPFWHELTRQPTIPEQSDPKWLRLDPEIAQSFVNITLEMLEENDSKLLTAQFKATVTVLIARFGMAAAYHELQRMADHIATLMFEKDSEKQCVKRSRTAKKR
jgi:hypothetical protein